MGIDVGRTMVERGARARGGVLDWREEQGGEGNGSEGERVEYEVVVGGSGREEDVLGLDLGRDWEEGGRERKSWRALHWR
jgi:hypothetical protein